MRLLCLACCCLAGLAAAASSAAAPKVIVMILGDDYGWWNIEMPQHNPEARTPNMLALAKEGVILNRHYVYKYCSPTRSSLLTGRLPIHVNQNNECNTLSSASGADIRMTTIAQKLKQANFSTHFLGKWHMGARSPSNLPINRGFDSHIGFLKGAEDHFDQRSNFDGYAKTYIDLWQDHGPEPGRLNGTYSVERDAAQAVRIIEAHDTAASPLYLHVMFQACHSPYQVPDRFRDPSINDKCRQTYHAMATAMDEGIGNITAALKAKGVWDDVLLVFSADNGAPTKAGQCGNNYPLRGGKTSSFEGGVRTSAFVGGGFVPAAARGRVHDGLMHIADWYSTFAHLVGVDPKDSAAANAKGVPPIDSIDQWPSIVAASASPRTEVPLAFCTNIGGASDDCASSKTPPTPGVNGSYAFDQGGLISMADDGTGLWKVLFGDQHGLGFWTGPQHPNGTADYKDAGCPNGCLFNLDDDPTEHMDLKAQQPQRFAALRERLLWWGKTVFQTNYTDVPSDAQCGNPQEVAQRYNGHIGPQCGLPTLPTPSPTPPPPTPPPFGLRQGGHCLSAARGAAAYKTAPLVVPCDAYTATSAEWAERTDYAPAAQQVQALLTNVGTAGTDYYLKLNETPGATARNISRFCARGSTYLNSDMPASGANVQGFVVVRTPAPADNMGAVTVKLASTACRSTNGAWGLCAALDEQAQALVLKDCATGGAAVAWTLQ